MIGTIVLLAIIVIVAGWLVGIFNSLVALRNQVKNAWAQIDVQLKRRHDLIPNLVEMVKDYMSYEQETLQKVIAARSVAVGAQGVAETAQAENMLTGALRQLFALAESYPDLKANQNVSQLQEELTSTENKIAFARQYYNDSVMKLNNKIEQFPSNLIAGMTGFTKAEHYDIPEEDREPVKVDLR